MSTPSLALEWPADQLETVGHCPLCRSTSRRLAYAEVQDWAFHCAPGRWTYWDCEKCDSLYLDPRPTQASIGRAYANYYTHADSDAGTATARVGAQLKNRLRNELLSLRLGASVGPRLHLPRMLMPLLRPLAARIVMPFGWDVLARSSKGRFMDVGCGAGKLLRQAARFGWNAQGLEIDPKAVQVARASGLDVTHGTYEKLSDQPARFDCIMCSHVLEHVHDPLDMLARMKQALRPDGVLLLTLPNAQSVARHHFGPDWRGLEAPRHLAIPSQTALRRLLVLAGFTVQSQADQRLDTAAESFRIARRGLSLSTEDVNQGRQLTLVHRSEREDNDLIKLVCTLTDERRANG